MEGSVSSLDKHRAVKFLESLRDNAFVAIVFEGDHVKVYAKGAESDHLDAIKEALEEMCG